MASQIVLMSMSSAGSSTIINKLDLPNSSCFIKQNKRTVDVMPIKKIRYREAVKDIDISQVDRHPREGEDNWFEPVEKRAVNIFWNDNFNFTFIILVLSRFLMRFFWDFDDFNDIER